ncbi:hypothetical protein I551_2751 [Mycobacterium ulcerans str. Harvey]|uniref:Uncharacterized protein n=1 Tax=Mycobacterium ulcerans str. Harvey TaxID=1299332 RepID=A0ABN0R150_MYCUL|nr:hypothetical protein I551_2751 [Mycobacterium ulcerans str. Harvey]
MGGKWGRPVRRLGSVAAHNHPGPSPGRPRLAPLVYLRIDGKMFIVGSFRRCRCRPGLGA